jgi:D-cysteine desulfhydrase
LEELPRLTSALGGPRLWIKRDDQTGLALGGNKARKLEFLLGDARAQQADTLITLGAAQSNHCRQTAAAAACAGLNCELILNGHAPETPTGNLLLDELLGAKLHWVERSQRAAKSQELTESLRRAGRRPYLIPVGGSNAVGTAGYAAAMLELAEQLKTRPISIDYLVVASSSGGTQAGMVVGAKAAGFTGQILGISIDRDLPDDGPYEEELAELANQTARRIGENSRFAAKDFNVVRGYMGGGYGVVGELERNAIRILAREQGILLDPVYAGRAFGAMLDLIAKKRFKPTDNVLFWHTGGTPALFAYEKGSLTSQPSNCP